jgi:hypothetical protein
VAKIYKLLMSKNDVEHLYVGSTNLDLKYWPEKPIRRLAVLLSLENNEHIDNYADLYTTMWFVS